MTHTKHISVTDIRNYIKETEVIKIMVTYDSLDKVISALGDKVNGLDPIKKPSYAFRASHRSPVKPLRSFTL